MGLFDFLEQSGRNIGIDIPIQKQMIIDLNDDVSMQGQINKSSTWPLVDNMLKGIDVIHPPGDYKAFVQTYASVVWVYVCVWVISSSIGSLPLRFWTGTGKDKRELEKDHLVRKLFKNPNPFDTMEELIEMVTIYLETTGDAYIEKFGMEMNPVKKGFPVKLFNLESQNISIVPDPIEKIKYYNYTLPDASAKDTSKKFFRDELSHIRYPNPQSIFYGQGAITPLQTTIVSELYRELYNKSFFENEARPDVVLKHNADITKGIAPLLPEARKAVAQAWHKAFGGPRKNKLPVLLESGMDISILSESIKDMEFREMERSLRERVFAAYGVPPVMAGIYDSGGNSSVDPKEQISIFWDSTIPPKAMRIANSLNRDIIQPSFPDVWCEFDMSVIKVLEESPKEHEERLSRILERGGITFQEYREGLGYEVDEKDPWKDKRILSANFVNMDDFFLGLPEDGTENGGVGTGGEGSLSAEANNNLRHQSEEGNTV